MTTTFRDPNVFGPLFWKVINHVCATLDQSTTYNTVQKYQLFHTFVCTIQAILPCVYCKESFRLYTTKPIASPHYQKTILQQSNFIPTPDKPESIIYSMWSYRLRMLINFKLMCQNPEQFTTNAKSIYPFKVARARFIVRLSAVEWKSLYRTVYRKLIEPKHKVFWKQWIVLWNSSNVF